MRYLALIVSMLTVITLPAQQQREMSLNEVLSEEDLDERYITARRDKAASYRIERERVYRQLSDTYHQQAASEAKRIAGLLERGAVPEARKAAIHALRTWPYSDSAGHLQHLQVRCHLAFGDLRRARLALVDLVERFTDYSDINIAYEEALLVARKVQCSGPLVNLQAIQPRDVINVHHIGRLPQANTLFRYLVQVGDRREVAPAANLQYARSLLVVGAGNRERLLEARIAYEFLLDRYPDSPYVFDALCELAVSHLLSYRGDLFDVGALITAASHIAQAKVYIGDDVARAKMITAYEDLILHWHQERDLQVARWYRNKRKYQAARLYYDEARKHNPASAAGLAAARELAKLPSPATAKP